MKARKYPGPPLFGSQMASSHSVQGNLMLVPYKKSTSHTVLSNEKSLVNLNLPVTEVGMTLSGLYQKSAQLELQHQKLELKIQEQHQTLKVLQQAIQSATSNLQSTSASHLAAGLAHEIRNPLTTIKGFIQLLKPELQETGKQELADVALDELNRANSLLSEFLSILKPGFSERKQLSISDLAASMIKLFTSECILKDIELCGELPEKELFIFADENAIKQVLVNLLKNALEAVEGNRSYKGRIILGVKQSGNSVDFSVIDNGGGIEECVLKKIFTPFYTTKEKGSGMGLAISKQIIESHGGQFSVTTHPSRTTFKFSLPLI